ncbi:thiamine biosynthetic bifunctional enzyme Thi4 [Rhodotorula toruloides]|uniref:Thiamine biosynthetic bifunctional enzyme Thi4 n=1 Tax=Rhodotorula toruloides TaxID=5286 RepID=A0A2T0A648_RHOTO|nr:thiamine biosynthetic bifunctional enzyme Thi4 [Rhodotorula toruloides]
MPNFSLYYVTGRSLLPPPPSSYTGPKEDYYLAHLEQALKGGVTVVQVREKDVDGAEFLEVARRTKEVCDKYDVPLFINDRVDVALALKCHCHVGQTDLPARLVRQLLGPDALIGVSVNTPEEMQVVMDEGVADYVGVGPCFGTQTKKNLNPILGPRGVRAVLETLGESEIKAVIIGESIVLSACFRIRRIRRIRRAGRSGCTLAGGITPSTIPNVLAQTPAPLPSGGYRALDGLAVVSAIAASTEPETAARELREMFDRKPAYPSRLLDPGELSADHVVEQAVELLRILKDGEKTPLVHHITNFVVMNDTANLTLAFGASPIMSASPDEAPHLSQLISCLLLNLGTITEAQLNAQKIAGAAANKNRKPVVFDPVGVGATEYRKKSASDLLNTCHVSIIKGNAGEIGALSGLSEVKARGVDSVGKGFKDPATVVKTLAAREKLVVAMSGETDYISDGQVSFTIKNGTFWQEKITGSGCMASAAVALFAGLQHESGPFIAAIAGLLAINVAAEIAAARPEVNGPNTFRAALIDACYNLRPEDVRSRAKVQRV